MQDGTAASLGRNYDVWVAAVDSTYRDLVATVAALVPDLVGALLLLLFGWLLAFLLRNLILRLGTGLDRLSEGLRMRSGIEAGRLRWPVSRVVAVTVYWLVIVFFLAVAADVLGLAAIAEVVSRILGFVPTVLLTAAALLLIVVLSGSVSNLVQRKASAAHIANPAALAALARALVIAMACIIALGQVGVDTTLLVSVFSLVVASFLVGAALAFGLGASGAVRNIIAARQARLDYRPGQRVRVVGHEGEIIELTSTAVVLDTRAGRTTVPATVFQDNVCVLLDDADDGV